MSHPLSESLIRYQKVSSVSEVPVRDFTINVIHSPSVKDANFHMELLYINDFAERRLLDENCTYANCSDIFCKTHGVYNYSIGIGIAILAFLCFAVYGLILVKKRLARREVINKQTAADKHEKQNVNAEHILQINTEDEKVYIDNELYTSTESVFLESGIARLNTETFNWDQKIVSAEKIDLNRNEETQISLQEISSVESLKDINQIKAISPEAIDWKATCAQISNELMSYCSSIYEKTEANENYSTAQQKTSFTEFPFKYRQAKVNSCFMETKLQDIQSETNKSIISLQSYQRKENMGNEMNKRRSFKIEQNIPEKPYTKNGANTQQLEWNKRKSYSVAGNQINKNQREFTFEKRNNEFKTDDRTNQHRYSVKGKITLPEDECEENLLYEDLGIPQENNSLHSENQHCLPPYPSRISENSPSLLRERSSDFEEEYVDNCLYDDLEEILQENNHLQRENNNCPSPHASSIIDNTPVLLKERPSDFEEEYVDNCLYDGLEEILQENNHLQHENNNCLPSHASSITDNTPALLKEGPSDFEEKYVDNCIYDDPEEFLQENNRLQYEKNNCLPSHASSIIDNTPVLLNEGPSDFEEEYVDNCLYDNLEEILQENNHLQRENNNCLPSHTSSIIDNTPVLLKEGPSDFEEEYVDNCIYDDPEKILQGNNHLQCEKNNCYSTHESSISKNSLIKESSSNFEEEYTDNCFYHDLEEILKENNHLQCEKNNYLPPHTSSISDNNLSPLKESLSDFTEEYVDNCLYDDPQEILKENNHLQCEKNNYLPPHASSISDNNLSPLKESPSDFTEEYVDNCLYDDPQEILKENNHLQCEKNNYLPPHTSSISDNNLSPLKESPSDFTEEYVDNCLYDDPQEILKENNHLQCEKNNYLPPHASSISDNNPSPLKESPSDFTEEYVDNCLYDDPQEILKENIDLEC